MKTYGRSCILLRVLLSVFARVFTPALAIGLGLAFYASCAGGWSLTHSSSVYIVPLVSNASGVNWSTSAPSVTWPGQTFQFHTNWTPGTFFQPFQQMTWEQTSNPAIVTKMNMGAWSVNVWPQPGASNYFSSNVVWLTPNSGLGWMTNGSLVYDGFDRFGMDVVNFPDLFFRFGAYGNAQSDMAGLPLGFPADYVGHMAITVYIYPPSEFYLSIGDLPDNTGLKPPSGWDGVWSDRIYAKWLGTGFQYGEHEWDIYWNSDRDLNPYLPLYLGFQTAYWTNAAIDCSYIGVYRDVVWFKYSDSGVDLSGTNSYGPVYPENLMECQPVVMYPYQGRGLPAGILSSSPGGGE